MIIHDAVKQLEEAACGMGIEEGDLLYQPFCDTVCQFYDGVCMTCSFGGRVAEIATSEPFSARMHLSDLYHAPLKSTKTRIAALGALNVASGFLMLTRKIGGCNSVYYDDCREELCSFCRGKAIYMLGTPISGIETVKMEEDAELILINADAFYRDETLDKINQYRIEKRKILLIGQNCHGIAALLHLDLWCPYST